MQKMFEPTVEKAHAWLKNRTKDITMTGARGVYKKAVEELEYRIQKKPVEINSRYGGQFVPACPTCGYEFYDEGDYCPMCGQAIDWSALEEENV